MMQPAMPETRQLREERIQRARPPSYEYGIEILATLYVASSYYNWSFRYRLNAGGIQRSLPSEQISPIIFEIRYLD